MLDKKKKSKPEGEPKQKSSKFGDKDFVYMGGHSFYLNDVEKVENNFVYMKAGNKILISETESEQIKKILG